MLDYESWEKDQDMLYYMGERDGKGGDYNTDYSWSESYRNGYFDGKMNHRDEPVDYNPSFHLDNY
ncbi:MAG: hypothetical protein RBU29_10870 [bacterium]|nr:hypothetical protein [bacterium]